MQGWLLPEEVRQRAVRMARFGATCGLRLIASHLDSIVPSSQIRAWSPETGGLFTDIDHEYCGIILSGNVARRRQKVSTG
jgi:hypothetical protein